MSGKGAIACTHPLSAGLFGRYSRIANDLVAASDALIVVGCKLGEIPTRRFQLIPPGKPLIHIDILAEEIGRTTRTDVALVADARLALQDLAAALGDGKTARATRQPWCAEVPARMAKWREGAADRLKSNEKPINVGRLMGELNAIMPDDAILVADGGFAAHWGGLLFDTKRAGRHFIADRGFASIGYGLPGSMGAQLAAPKRRVVGLTGDGGFNMTLGELETARRAGTPFVLCVFNNAASGYVKALQHSMFGAGNYQSSDLVEMDYAAITRAMGCNGIRVEDPAQLAPALREGLENTATPTVLDIVVTRDPAKMLPGVDNRTLVVNKGDRPVYRPISPPTWRDSTGSPTAWRGTDWPSQLSSLAELRRGGGAITRTGDCDRARRVRRLKADSPGTRTMLRAPLLLLCLALFAAAAPQAAAQMTPPRGSPLRAAADGHAASDRDGRDRRADRIRRHRSARDAASGPTPMCARSGPAARRSTGTGPNTARTWRRAR